MESIQGHGEKDAQKYCKRFTRQGSHRRLKPAAPGRRVAAVAALILQPLASEQAIVRGVADYGFDDRAGASNNV
jgi:hypothetical protein